VERLAPELNAVNVDQLAPSLYELGIESQGTEERFLGGSETMASELELPCHESRLSPMLGMVPDFRQVGQGFIGTCACHGDLRAEKPIEDGRGTKLRNAFQVGLGTIDLLGMKFVLGLSPDQVRVGARPKPKKQGCGRHH